MSTTNAGTRRASSEVGEYLAVIRARKWTLIRVLLAVFVVAIVFTAMQHPTYQGTSEVLLTFNDSSAGTGANNVVGNLSTEKVLIASPAITVPVVKSLGLSISPATLAKQVKVSVPTGATVLKITYTNGNRELASKIANAFADEYVNYRTEQAAAAFSKAATALTDQVNKLDAALLTAQKGLAQASAPGPKTAYTHQIAKLTAERKVVEAQLTVVTAPSQAPPRVIRRAPVPTQAASPSWPHNLLAAGAGGLALGLILVFLGDALDDKIKSRAELQVVTGVPTLAEVPAVPAWASRKEAGVHLIRSEMQEDGAKASFSALATNVLFLAGKQPAQVLLVTSAVSGEGKTTVAANLGVDLAGTGRTVCLVDLNLGAPALYNVFGLEGRVGMSSVLLGPVALEDALEDTIISNLRIISGSATEANAGKLAEAFRDGTYLEELRAAYDFVILDTPAVGSSDVANVLARVADGVIVVVDPDALSTSDLRASLEALRSAGANILGSVHNGAGITADAYAAYSAYGAEASA